MSCTPPNAPAEVTPHNAPAEAPNAPADVTPPTKSVFNAESQKVLE